jgi:hypothetical protein
MAESLGYLFRRKIRKKFKEYGATSKENAKSLEELDLKLSNSAIKYLKFIEDIKEADDGRYYVECKDEKQC